MRLLLYFQTFILLTLVGLCSCTHEARTGEKLLEIRNLIKSQPALAQEMLDSIDQEDLTSATLRARYTLLDTYCKYRNNQEGTDDSKIAAAKDYLLKHGTGYEKMMAAFLQGCILDNAGKKGPAITCYKTAIDEGEQIEDHFMLGQTYSFMFRLCGSIMDSDYKKYAEAALKHYTLHGDSSYIRDAKVNMGIAYLDKLQFDSCITVFNETRAEAMLATDTFIWAKCNRFLAEAEMQQKQYAEALAHMEESKSRLGWRFNSRDYDVLSILYAMQGERELAFQYMDSARYVLEGNVDSIFHLKTKANLYNILKEGSEAYKYLQDYHALVDSTHAHWLYNSVMKEQRDFVEKQLVETEIKATNQLIMIVALLFLVAVSGAAFFLYKKNKAETIRHLQAESALQMAKEESLTKELQTRQENERLLQEQLIQKERNRQQVLYCIKQTEPVQHLREALKNQGKVSGKDWEELDTIFNDMLPEFAEKLMDNYQLNETEWRISQLQKLNFTPSEIADLICKAPNSISSSSARMYKKVHQKEGGAKDWIDFIHTL